MSLSTEAAPLQRKRNREEIESAENTVAGSACLIGQAPKFSRHKEGTSDVKYGTGVETNEHRIETRLKQIQFGKNTIGYDNYLAAVPKKTRSKQQAIHPRTPDPYEESSKRQFDGRVKAWRRELHKWDVMDNIAQVVAPPPGTGKRKETEVESGEVVAGGAQTDDKQNNYGSWAKQLPPPVNLVVAPVLALGSNTTTSKAKKSASNEGAAGHPSSSFGAAGTELDSPSGKGSRSYGEAIGEDIEAIEGVDYDCEAPSDCDEDVL